MPGKRRRLVRVGIPEVLSEPWREEDGSLVAELAVFVPLLIVALMMGINGLMFVSECARFDRVAAETARFAVSDDRSPHEVLNTALGYTQSQPYSATAGLSTRLDMGVFSYQEVVCTLTYRPWPLGQTLFAGTPFAWKVPGGLTHTQAFVIDKHKNGILF